MSVVKESDGGDDGSADAGSRADFITRKRKEDTSKLGRVQMRGVCQTTATDNQPYVFASIFPFHFLHWRTFPQAFRLDCWKLCLPLALALKH